MPAKPRSATSPHSPAKQLDAFIKKLDPPIAKIVREARRALRRRWPTATELIYAGYALAIGLSSTERMSDTIVSIAAYARGVNLYFMYGVELADPAGVLLGNGNQGRFVRLESVADMERPEISALLSAAALNGDTPLPAKGGGRVIIKSVSKKFA